MLIESLKPLRVHLRRTVVDLVPGQPIELADDEGERLLAKVPDAVRPVVQAGNWIEWLSLALPKQRGEVLAVHPDKTFEVYHPLTQAVCRLPVGWVTKILKRPY